MGTIIVDLDNCIADDGWRIPRINWAAPDKDKRYHDYHTLAAFDRCDDDWLSVLAGDVVVFTARPVAYAALTREWVKRNMRVQPKHIMMRNNRDDRPSSIIKREMLRRLVVMPEYGLRGVEDVLCAFDDHPAIVEMYRIAGINAERRCIHNIDAYVDPTTGRRHE